MSLEIYWSCESTIKRGKVVDKLLSTVWQRVIVQKTKVHKGKIFRYLKASEIIVAPNL